MARLFVAVWPPAAIIEDLVALDLGERSHVRVIDPSRWHITLAFLGDTDPGLVIGRLGQAALPVAQAELGPRLTVLGRGAIVVPVGGLDQLAAKVRTAVDDLLSDRDRLGFRGHLTVARRRRSHGDDLPDRPVSGSFLVSEVTLVASHQSSEGSRYETLASWSTVEQ